MKIGKMGSALVFTHPVTFMMMTMTFVHIITEIMAGLQQLEFLRAGPYAEAHGNNTPAFSPARTVLFQHRANRLVRQFAETENHVGIGRIVDIADDGFDLDITDMKASRQPEPVSGRVSSCRNTQIVEPFEVSGK